MIYVVGVPGSVTLPVKIGTSEDVGRRLIQLQRGESMPLAIARAIPDRSALDVLASYPGDRDVERNLHIRFADRRIEGEWFGLGATDAAVELVDRAMKECSSPTLFAVSRHPERRGRGDSGGGQFRSNTERAMDSWKRWVEAGEPTQDPFPGFSRDQLKQVAKARGLVTYRHRGAPRDQFANLLKQDLAAKDQRPTPSATKPAGRPSATPHKDYEKYQAWVRAGFTPEQAMQLLVATLDHSP